MLAINFKNWENKRIISQFNPIGSSLNHFYATHTTRAHLVTPSISQEKLDQKWLRITKELRTTTAKQINKIKMNNDSIKQVVAEPEPAKNIFCPSCITGES